MWLIVGQLFIKTEGQNVPLALRNFSRSDKQKLSANVAISLHSYPHLYQSTIWIFSCGFKLVFSSRLFSSTDAEGFLGIIALRCSMSNDISVFICLIIFSSIPEELVAWEKYFFPFHCVLTLSACLNMFTHVFVFFFQLSLNVL